MYNYKDKENKNLNTEYFSNIYKFNNNKPYLQPENKIYNNSKNNNDFDYSRDIKSRNFNIQKNVYNKNKKHKGFFYDYYNDQVQLMNMKIDLKVIEHKLNSLLNIYSPDEAYIPKNRDRNSGDNSENIINNENNSKNRIQENNLNLNNDDNKNLDDNKSEKNNNEINNNEFDNHSINSPNMQMAIENVISFNNINDSEEKNIKENTNIKAKKLEKDNIIHLLDEKNNNLEEKNILIKNNLDNINNINNIISASKENNLDKKIINENESIDKNDKNEEEESIENAQLIPERDFSIDKEEENNDNNNKKNKKVHFDNNLVYINYDQDDFITELELTDQNDRIIPYRQKDFTKYLRLLTSISNTSKLKSIMSQSKKRKKKKKTKIMERNIELIKHIEKNGIIYSSNVKDSDKKRLYSYNKNSKNCRKFMENPQQFFTEDLCDVMLLQYDIYPKEHLNNSCMNSNKKIKEKK